MFEFIKSARHGKSLVEHFLSLLLAGGTAAEFWMVRQVGNSTFLLFVVICFVDLFAGFAASLRRARRAVVVAEPVRSNAGPRRACAGRAGSRGACPGRAARAHPFTTAPPMPRAEPVIRVRSRHVVMRSPCKSCRTARANVGVPPRCCLPMKTAISTCPAARPSTRAKAWPRPRIRSRALAAIETLQGRRQRRRRGRRPPSRCCAWSSRP